MKSKNVKSAFTIGFMALSMLVSVSSFSQQKMQKTPEERATMTTNKMKTDLTLSDEQYQKVKAINLDFATKSSELQKEGDKTAWVKKMKPLDEERSKSLKEVLTADQFAKYEKMRSEMKARMKGKMKEKS